VAAVAVIALAAAGVLAVSRSSVASRLASADAELRDSHAQLADTRTQIDELTQQVTQLEGARDAAQSQLDDANAKTRDAQRSLTACHVFFRTSAELFRTGTASPDMKAKLTAELVSCYEGEVPPSLFS
jgi:peptidoglycan hydrolase CwlO-like protein